MNDELRQRIYDEGYQAGYDGDGVDCPYLDGSHEAEVWGEACEQGNADS